MAQKNTRRVLGTVLMGLGLLLILILAGCIALSDIQGAQVREGLQNSASAEASPTGSAAGPAAVTRAAATATTQVSERTTPAEPARTAEVVKDTATATREPVQATVTATRKPVQAAATATRKPAPVASAATATRAPSATPVTPAPAAPAPTAATGSGSQVEPVRMTIPDLKIDAQVIPMGWEVVQTKNGPVSQWVIPKSAAGHHINSVGLGEPGNLVISGHNNIYGQVFKPISLAWDNDSRTKVDDFTDRSDILTGRTIELFDTAGKKFTYRITDFLRLKDTGVSQQQRIANGRFILPTGDERVTIVTCWPPTNNTHRLIVVAQPAP